MDNNRRNFTILVIGDKPMELLEKYNSNKNIQHITICTPETAKDKLNETLGLYKRLLDAQTEDSEYNDFLNLQIGQLSAMTPQEYYASMAEKYEKDEKTGELYTEINPYGKFDCIRTNPLFALPLITKDGKEVYTAKKCEVDWSKMHMTDATAYEIAWDTVMGGKKVETDDEKLIYENMKNRTAYFQAYVDRDNYIKSNTSYWCYAVLDKKGWNECEEQFEWVCNFYDTYIKKLPDNVQLTIVEGYRQENF